MNAPNVSADVVIREWIVDILRSRPDVTRLALRQRAKFEGWLKFELAAKAETSGMRGVVVEAATSEEMSSRADLTFFDGEIRHDIELKTCNTNWRIRGVRDATRPITKNLAGIITDAIKLRHCSGRGIVAVCMFPIPLGDCRWHGYLSILSVGTGIPLSADRNAKIVHVPIEPGSDCEAVVISFFADSLCSGSIVGVSEDSSDTLTVDGEANRIEKELRDGT